MPGSEKGENGGKGGLEFGVKQGRMTIRLTRKPDTGEQ
jgi:hypothetical protein